MGFTDVLAWPHDTGVAGSAILTAAMGVPAYIHTHLKIARHHTQQRALEIRHHVERMAQATAQHNARAHQAEKHHRQLMDQVRPS
jgi:hypothetical protein